jgi:acyl-[acyl carrier protein]--UDP-N-acetylglucosamine O-acyltransferase
MYRLLAPAALLLLSACSSTAKYVVMPDGSAPVLYPAENVLRWPVVDGAYQAPSGHARIYIDETVKFDKDVRLGDGVRIGRNSSVDEDTTLLPNVTVGEDTSIRGDVVIGANTKIGNHVWIWGDAKIGADSVVEDGVTVGKWRVFPAGSTIAK